MLKFWWWWWIVGDNDNDSDNDDDDNNSNSDNDCTDDNSDDDDNDDDGDVDDDDDDDDDDGDGGDDDDDWFLYFHQQLQKNGSTASELPPWSAGDSNIGETTEETNKAEQEKQVSQMPVDKNTIAEIVREVEGSQDINLVYSNVEDPATASAQQNLQAQGGQTVLPEPGITVLASRESEGNENDLYETIVPSQPLRKAPPKPLPYSLTKKLSGTAGGSGTEKVLEKVGFCNLCHYMYKFIIMIFLML